MVNYVLIELDTIPPEINIYLPPYTTNDLINQILIEADETLSNYQEIYVIDSNGERHDYTFEKIDSNKFEGIVKFATLPIGTCVIYARMKDEVDNFSNIVSKSFVVKESLTLLVLNIEDTQRDIGYIDKSKDVELKDYSRDIKYIDKSKVVTAREYSREMKINDDDRGVLDGSN
jgi:hypothetical protein